MARIVLCLNCNLGWQISKLQKIPSRGYKCPQCISKKEPRSCRSKKAQEKNILSRLYHEYLKEVNMQEQRILNLLRLCLQAREKGHDVFFDYSPHVQSVRIYGFVDGWREEKNRDIDVYFYLDDAEENIAKIEETEKFLEGLM